MPDLKISQLNNGDPAQTNDQIPINRAGVNFSITAGSIASLATANSANTEVLFNNAGVVDGDPQFTFNPTGDVLSLTGQLNVDNLRADGNVLSATNTNGPVVLTPNGTGTVGIGGATASFPALKNSGTALEVRLADNSAYAAVTALTATITDTSANTSAIAASDYSLTGSNTTPMVILTGTWNTTGIATGVLLNLTNTASGAGSMLLDLETNSVSQFSVFANGNTTMTGTVSALSGTFTQTSANLSAIASTSYSLTGSSAVSMVDLAGTWNTSGTPTLIKANVTDTASNAASLLMDLQVGGSSRFRVTKTGGALIAGAGALGYATGSGGAVTQATSRTTGVTLDKTNGAITLVSAAGDATNWTSFTVTNSTVAATDTIIVSQKSGTDKYTVYVTALGAGSFELTFRTTGGTTTEQPVFNFSVIKAVAA
jgi:hypothetical protein